MKATKLPTCISWLAINLAPNQIIPIFVTFKTKVIIGNIKETMLKTLIPVSV